MELDELRQRLPAFAEAHVAPDARVVDAWKMPGHAGFSYGFAVETAGGRREFYLRLPPPGVRYAGTADLSRQVRILRALQGSKVPVAEVLWEGDDERWFGRPYFVTPKFEGHTLRFEEGDWAWTLTPERLRPMAEQAARALANIHRLDWEQAVPELGPPLNFEEDVTRWDRFLERAAEPQALAEAPRVRERLLARMPGETRIGVFHGDFQWTNLFYSEEGRLLAVIDWELVNIGACLNDLGWLWMFTEPSAWDRVGGGGAGLLPRPEELVAVYEDELGEPAGDVRWFAALAAYKFGIITGLNLSLHRAGKRDDPFWEEMVGSMTTNMAFALRMLE